VSLLVACPTTIRVTFANGSPAAYASIMVYRVDCFLWWCWDGPLISAVTAGFDGKATVTLEQGKTYHVYASARDASGALKKRDVYQKPTYCPFYIGIWLPA